MMPLKTIGKFYLAAFFSSAISSALDLYLGNLDWRIRALLSLYAAIAYFKAYC